MTKMIRLDAVSLIVLSLAMWFAQKATGQGSKDVTVCVGADSVVRLPASGACPRGSEEIQLAGPESKKLDNDDDTDPLGSAKKEASKVDGRLAALEQRLSDLENSSLFEVVDKTGRVIFSVAPDRVRVYNEHRIAVAEMLVGTKGGGFLARSTDGTLSDVLGAFGEYAGLRLREGDQKCLDLLRQEAGNYSLRIRSGEGTIAGVGESRAGTGALIVGNKIGQLKAALEVNGDKGAVNIFNNAGRGVASLTEAPNGGGLLTLTDAGGSARVAMLSNNNRYGVVMTFPTGMPYVPKSGLPGSYMLGCAGGGACVP